MKLDDFRALKEDERVKLINDRLKQLKDDGLTTKDFRSAELEFSYTSAYKEMELLEYGRHGDMFVKHIANPSLSESEIATLKRMISDYESIDQEQELEPKVVRRTDDTVTSTSIRVYKKVWQRFQAFSKEWNIYHSSDLVSLALERFLDQHGFNDYESLLKQGKIEEKTKEK